MMEYVWVWQKRSKKRVLFSHWKVVICKIKICKKIYGVFLNKLKLSTTFCLEENFSTPVHIIKYIHTSTLRDMEQLLGSRCCKWPGKSTIESKSTNFKPEYTKFRNVQCKNPRWRFFFGQNSAHDFTQFSTEMYLVISDFDYISRFLRKKTIKTKRKSLEIGTIGTFLLQWLHSFHSKPLDMKKALEYSTIGEQ